MILRSHLFRQGFRFRIHRKDLPGKPDIVLTKFKTVIFVNGCFWHNHKKCKEGRIPLTNSNFWKEKLQRNVRNDKENIEKLKSAGWKVLVLWECEIEKYFDKTMHQVISKIIHSE